MLLRHIVLLTGAVSCRTTWCPDRFEDVVLRHAMLLTRAMPMQVLMRNARKQLIVENGGQAANGPAAAPSSSVVADGHAHFPDATTPEQQTAPARRDIDLRTYDEVLCLLDAPIRWTTNPVALLCAWLICSGVLLSSCPKVHAARFPPS